MGILWLSFCVIVGLLAISHSINQLTRKLTEIYNHSVEHKLANED